MLPPNVPVGTGGEPLPAAHTKLVGTPPVQDADSVATPPTVMVGEATVQFGATGGGGGGGGVPFGAVQKIVRLPAGSIDRFGASMQTEVLFKVTEPACE